MMSISYYEKTFCTSFRCYKPLVDDGSTDNSGQICDEYAEKDHRIRVIHKKNGGLSDARNDGVRASTAPYILFVDADDWIEPTCCEHAYKPVMENHADYVLFLCFLYGNGMDTVKRGKELQTGPLNEKEALSFIAFYSCAAWLGLYQRELLEQIPFPSGKYFEDAATTHKLIHEAKKIWLLNEPLYHNRQGRPNSITSALETRTHPDRKEMHAVRINDLNEWGYESLA